MALGHRRSTCTKITKQGDNEKHRVTNCNKHIVTNTKTSFPTRSRTGKQAWTCVFPNTFRLPVSNLRIAIQQTTALTTCSLLDREDFWENFSANVFFCAYAPHVLLFWGKSVARYTRHRRRPNPPHQHSWNLRFTYSESAEGTASSPVLRFTKHVVLRVALRTSSTPKIRNLAICTVYPALARRHKEERKSKEFRRNWRL